jgi:hypothetical protein
MTHADQIMRAVAALVREQGKRVFTRAEVRKRIGVSQEQWTSGYTAVFQGMRADHPGGAPDVGSRWRGAFRRVEYGKYVLTQRGWQLVSELENEGVRLNESAPQSAKPSPALRGFGTRLRDILHSETTSGGEVTVGDVTVTPQSKSLTLRWPLGGLVWNRPVAVLVERGEQRERIPIVDVTRIVQLGLLAFSVVFTVVIFMLSAKRRRSRDE